MGSSQNIRIGREVQNRVRVMASGNIGWLFINGVYEAELDFRGLVGPGSISLVGAWLAGEEFPGFTVPFSDFNVQPLGRRFGPETGTIEHSPGDEHIDTHPTSVWLVDGIIEARFFNPYSSIEGDWTSGFLIRVASADEHHAVFIDDDGGWYHYLRMAGADTKLAEGVSEHISASPSGSNHIRIVALGESGLLFVNGALVSSLDLSGLLGSGKVAGLGAYFSSHAIAGKLTRVEDFTIWSVGTVTAPTPTSTPTPSPATPTITPTAPPAATQTPIATPAPTSTTASIGTLTPTPPPTPIATLTPEATNTPTATATPIPTATASTSTQAVGPQPHLKHLEEKQLMLTLINAEREKAGVGPVVLGTNNAAQLHADVSLGNCFFSHWGIDGLKPHMRYSLAGGYQSNGENGLGNHYCITTSSRSPAGFRYSSLQGIEQEIRQAMEAWMGSPGHRRNILDRWHKRVNIGLAWDRYNIRAYQHFEGDYIQYEEFPRLAEGNLYLSGSTKNGIKLSGERDILIDIYYDPPPQPLTRGQLGQTGCYDSGKPVASIRYPPGPNRSYTTDSYEKESPSTCLDPNDVPADWPVSHPGLDAPKYLWLQTITSLSVPWTTASLWDIGGDRFNIRVDLRNMLDEHGPGVYTVLAWGRIGSENVLISQYSIFHGVTPPDTYNPTNFSAPGTSSESSD